MKTIPGIADYHKSEGSTDLTLFFTVIGLTALGVIVMLSASAGISIAKTGSPSVLWVSHIKRVAMGLIVLMVLWRIDYHCFRWITRPLLFLAFVLLIWVLWTHRGGSVGRWVTIFGYSFQPSEFARMVLVLFLAESLIRKREQLPELSGTLPFLVIIASMAMLVALQPNSSMAAMIILVGGTMLFLGGVKLRYLIATGAVTVPALLGYMYLVPYQRARLLTFLNPMDDLTHHGYQRLQSLIALGRGGLFGVGPGNGRQKFQYLPEPYKDFIFSILGEEWGLIGTLVVVALFVIVFWRGMRIAKYAPDDFGRLIAAGLVFSMTYNALINVGVAVGALPTTGRPLPYLSFGGTCTIMFLGSVGILLNILVRQGRFFMH